MAERDILSEYGPDAKRGQGAECGGIEMEDVKPLPYSKPKGPTDQMRARPGLGGAIYPKGTQGKR